MYWAERTDSMNKPAKTLPTKASNQGSGWRERLRDIIDECKDIPPQVRAAELTRVDERVLDDSLFRFLTQHHAQGPIDDARAAAMRRRAESLSPYLDRSLVCVLITLPGVRYTIEIDPEEERVVHWEWQAG